jgi:hypothetical protein
MKNATKLFPCWRMAHAVIRERNRGWPGVGPPWRWLCSDIVRDRPAAANAPNAGSQPPMEG